MDVDRPLESTMFIPAYRACLGSSVLIQSADAYVGYLQNQQYGPATIRGYLHGVEHFARWVTLRRIPLSAIDETLTHQFVAEHLPVCRCPDPCQRSVTAVRPALAHLLHVLREEGYLLQPKTLHSPAIQDELARFDHYLNSACGLASATRTSRRQWVGRFLVDQFGSSPIDMDRIKPADIVRALVQPTNRYRPGTLQVLGSALRSYLRFRAATCGNQVEALMAAVLPPTHWRLDTVPKYLTTEEVDRFLGVFDQQSINGRRDYVMARCLLDMGLRGCEVAAIQLDDIKWREGTLTISHGKSRRSDVLPLAVPTGKAIVQYLRSARPSSTSRALFVRHHAPCNTPITVEVVRGAIRRAFTRCGLDRFTGTHVLRHTAAVRMRCAGASLKEVADVLRHRSLDTTMIYSKVDLPRLAAVAAPWPGGLS
jgi:integrase/recombinase XerD